MTKNTHTHHSGRSRLGRSAVAFLILWIVLRLAAPASADEWDTSAYKGWQVTKITVHGLDDEMSKKLVDGLALALRTGFLNLGRPIFFPQTLADDIQRTRTFLLQNGYPYAHVEPRFVPNKEKETLEVVLDVDKGPPVIVSSVTTPGIPAPLAEKVGEEMTVTGGTVFTDANARGTLQSIKTLLEESGHARATADVHVTWEDSTHVGVVFEVDAGPVYYFGDVNVSGASDDLMPVAKRTARIRRGRRYEPKLIDNAEQNLRLLGLFRQIRTQLVDAAPDTLDLNVELTMREPYEIQTGVRYWTDAKLDAGVLWIGRNLLKRGRGVSALASASSVLQRAELSTWWPAVLAARSRLSLTLGIRSETEEAYRSLETGGEIALGYDFTMETRIRLALSFSNVKITGRVDDPALVDTNNGVLNEYSLYWERDMRDDLIVPAAGYFTSLMTRWAPDGPLNDYKYVMIEPAIRMYKPLPRAPEVVLASRLTVGLGKPLAGQTDIPPNKRFYAGGASSMRGFARRKLGPLDPNTGAPLGGNAKLEASVELRFPLVSRFNATIFADAGQVWPTYHDMRLGDIEVAVGPGLWFNTVIGPIRVDVGYRLTDYEKTLPSWEWHFSIGPAF